MSNIKSTSLSFPVRIPGKEPATITSSRVDHCPGYRSPQSVDSWADVVPGPSAEVVTSSHAKDPGAVNDGFCLGIQSSGTLWGIVNEAYIWADRDYERVTAHEVRAASLAYSNQVALPDILSAAFWRSSRVFQNSYLRDMASILDGMATLGPVVVAQQVVGTGPLNPPP